jgi:DNA-binding transcriptional LysR family regulator
MELRHLRYFVTVAEELHFGRAAEKLHIAQPPLSQQIQQLERELGFSLFLRANRRVTLTAAGAVFLQDVTRSLQSIEQAVRAARRADRGDTGTLALGFSTSATFEVLPALLSRFRATCPNVEMSLYEMNAAEQVQALEDKRLDVGLARPAITGEGLTIETVLAEPLVVALPEGHSLVSQKVIALADLAEEPFVLSPEAPKPSYADSVKALCAGVGFVPQVVQEAREMPTILSLVAAGLGVTLTPASARNLRRTGLVYRPLSDPNAVMELVVAFRTGDSSPTLRRFLNIVRAYPS